MNIALVGAPGSGKTDLAQQLAAQLRESSPQPVIVIDNYVGEVEEKTQIAMGPMADYLGNLYVALERYARERVARQSEKNVVITCGTLLETAVYVAMNFVAKTEILDTAEKLEFAPRMDAVLRMMALLYNDIFEYDYAFYLPSRSGDDDTRFMDQQLQAGFEGFKLIPVTPLLDAETQVDDALAVLRQSEVQPA